MPGNLEGSISVYQIKWIGDKEKKTSLQNSQAWQKTRTAISSVVTGVWPYWPQGRKGSSYLPQWVSGIYSNTNKK